MTSPASAAPARVLSIDVLRGLTIALMILVNDPGDWGHTYTQLDHAPWNGFTLTDFVFPNFLFLVGISIIFSLESRIARGAPRLSLGLHMLRRSATLFAIKMFLTGFPHFHWTQLRIYGVLTRIALCYLVAGLICLAIWDRRRRMRILLAVSAGLLVGYWALMRFVPVPGTGVPTHGVAILDPDHNLAAFLDRAVNALTQRWFHTGRLYEKTRDPEGLLSTLPAAATTLLGAAAGLWLTRARTPTRPGQEGVISRTRCMSGLLVAGVLSLAAGLVWNMSFPINKNLWTSSYVLFSAGWSLLLLALFYYLIDIRGVARSRTGQALLYPWLVFGSNAITAFVLSNLVVEIMLWIKVPAGALVSPGDPQKHITVWLWTYRYLFARHASTSNTSLAFALVFTALCFLPNYLLYRRRIFLKI